MGNRLVSYCTFLLWTLATVCPFCSTSQSPRNVNSSFVEISVHGGFFSVGTIGVTLTEEGLFCRYSGSPFYPELDNYAFVPMAVLDTAKVYRLMEYINKERIYDVKGFQYPDEWVPPVDHQPLVFTLRRQEDTSICRFSYYYKHALIEEMIEQLLHILPKETVPDFRTALNMPEKGFVSLSNKPYDSIAITVLKPKVIYGGDAYTMMMQDETNKNNFLSLGDFVSIRVTNVLPKGDQNILLLTLAGFLYQRLYKDSSISYGFVPYNADIEGIWKVLIEANSFDQQESESIDKGRFAKTIQNDIKIEMFYHNTNSYQSFYFKKNDKRQKRLIRRINALIPKEDKDTFGVSFIH